LFSENFVDWFSSNELSLHHIIFSELIKQKEAALYERNELLSSLAVQSSSVEMCVHTLSLTYIPFSQINIYIYTHTHVFFWLNEWRVNGWNGTSVPERLVAEREWMHTLHRSLQTQLNKELQRRVTLHEQLIQLKKQYSSILSQNAAKGFQISFYFLSIQFNSIQFNSIQLISFNSIQFNSIQFNYYFRNFQ
jgi:hypothetical protein